jgi:FkbM family methyltransferase
MKKAAQFILEKAVSSNTGSLFGKLKLKIISKIKNRIFTKELVSFNLNGKEILLPLSHDLPIIRTTIPFYSENIGRIVYHIKKKYNNLSAIDIGANVGDTVFIIKSYVDIPILCIEGDDNYFSLLNKNISKWDNVAVEKSFVGDNSIMQAEYVSSKGSGKIITGSLESKIKFEKLDSILERNESFRKSKFIKIDTDGFDIKIIKNEIDIFEMSKPIIFFEYDPFLFENLGENGFSVFEELHKIGYEKLVFYDNTGEYLLTTDLNNKLLIEDLHYFFSGRKNLRYCDICAFHSEDSDLADEIRLGELKYFADYRGFKLK